jgi:hypothetical protein
MRALLCVLLWAQLAWTASEGLDLHVRTNRTAMWVGDRLQYIVRVEHGPSVEFVSDHLKKEEMNLQPFELLDVRNTTGALPNGRKFFEVKLLLTIYDVGRTEAVVPSFNLFYFRQGKAQSKDDSPAEILTVPTLTVGLRSTLADPAGRIRDYKDVLPIPTVGWVLPEILGWCGLAAIAICIAWLAVAQIRSQFWKRSMAARTNQKSLSESLDEIRHAPVESAEEVDSFYKKASGILRALAAAKVGDGDGLAPTFAELLEQCDVIRYAPDGLERGRNARQEFLRKLEELTERH